MNGSRKYDLVVAGAGPAGCAAALRAARSGASVLLLERGRYPRHKVCGEFISPEGVGLLETVDSSLAQRLLAPAPRIAGARLFLDGSLIQSPLAPAAASVTRFALDHALWEAARQAGVECLEQTTVHNIWERFLVGTTAGNIPSRAVLVAAGRWSNLRYSGRNLRRRKWVGLKAHYREPQPSPTVDLYFFPAGYCGVQPISADVVNVCAMVRAGVARTLEQVFALHPELQARSRSWSSESDLVSTSPLIFTNPVPEESGVLFAGDAAAFIDPFLGDGISLALRSGVMAAECLEGIWTMDKDLDAAVAKYRRRYARELLPLFRKASVLRRLLALPWPVRKPLAAALQLFPVTDWMIRKTRLAPAPSNAGTRRSQ